MVSGVTPTTRSPWSTRTTSAPAGSLLRATATSSTGAGATTAAAVGAATGAGAGTTASRQRKRPSAASTASAALELITAARRPERDGATTSEAASDSVV